MNYIYDTGIFINIFHHYYPESFAGFWEKFDSAIKSGKIISTREVFQEISRKDDLVLDWAKQHKKSVFPEPTETEMVFVAKFFREKPHFQQIVKKRERLEERPCADPFVIAKAATENKCVVTTEILKPHAPKIPNICKEYGVEYTDLEGFMKREGWKF